jgi:insulin-like growth factor-binding protein complex acid labile subunit
MKRSLTQSTRKLTSNANTAASERMKCKYFFALVNCIFWIGECSAKYLISANDSVNVQKCDVESVRNIADINANPEEIIIQNCHIDELPNALFIRFHRLRQLEISESQLQSLTDFALNGLSALQLLNLSKNNLTTVKTWSNENLDALQLLDLRRNAIVNIDKDAFKHYPGLLKLNLAVNHIGEVPDELFRSLSNLKYLNLGKNNLMSIDSHTFKHLHKLLHLELKHNQIEFIDAESFFGCTHLRVLHLQVWRNLTWYFV